MKEVEFEKRRLSEKIGNLEQIISNQQNMIETTGYYMAKQEDRKEAPDELAEKMEEFDKLKYQGQLPKKALDIFNNASNLLQQEFNFYSFGVLINAEQKTEVMQSIYPRQLEMSLNDIVSDRDIKANELQSVNKMVNTFKKTEEQSNKRIQELQMKYEMVVDEKT
mmetsp:Transcript_4421/g.6476  ORF Transcript_4421/g.6476 Transcript_4421/m.6476 type:complete len:165 (+) Transcript_4421:1230-1724(+)